MWHPDPDLLALAALPSERRDAAVDEHLSGCALCRGHVESLRRTVELAVAGGTGGEDEDPPERIWTAITGELDIVEEPPPRTRWRRFALPVAAAVLGVAAGLGIGYAVAAAPPAERPLATLAPVESAGTGTAALTERAGVREMVVRVHGVTTPAGTDYLEAWLMDGTGTGLVSLGSLAPDGDGFRGAFTVPADLPLAEFGVLDVSAERWDGDAGHSGDSLLRGPVA
ncbi:anti-sigma factor [Pseudonocardia sp.]|uniref:anti-sigma factor n=1 Tax=Pseudonocardia sp. TaxID=60912 RepID=UPI002624026D|nr:anti-sigma factor [Pseudonocardia sp.]